MANNPTLGVNVAAAEIVDLTTIASFDTDGTLAANADTNVASQKATKTYADTKVSKSPSGNQVITNSHTLENDGGFIGPLAGDTQQSVPAAKTSSAAISEKQGLIRLGSTGVLTMTLADPASGAGPAADDGKRLAIMASTAHAHVITVTGGVNGGSNQTITLGGAVGDMTELEAIAGKWFLRPGINATVSA